MTTTLVTGARGFIGAYLLEALVASGEQVVAMTSRAPPAQRGPVDWVQNDLLDREATAKAVRGLGAKRLLHAAWLAPPSPVMASPENQAWRHASENLLTAFGEAGGARAALLGSCAEYDWSSGYCAEGVTPFNPATPYGRAKRDLFVSAERIAAAHGIALAWPRIFFVYGHGEHPARLSAAVTQALLDGRPVETTHGRQVRDYVHVLDVAAGVMAALDSDHCGGLDLASGAPTEVRELVTTIARQLGRLDLIRLGARQAPEGEAERVVGDPTAAFARIGWRAKIGLEEGVAQMIAAAKADRRESNGLGCG